MIGSVANEGLRGLQNSQRDISRAANEIARANVTPQAVAPGSDSQVATTFRPVEEGAKNERSSSLAEPLIELRRQEQIFNASAQVVATADKTIGSLLDTLA